jgi:hypothetical protein
MKDISIVNPKVPRTHGDDGSAAVGIIYQSQYLKVKKRLFQLSSVGDEALENRGICRHTKRYTSGLENESVGSTISWIGTS